MVFASDSMIALPYLYLPLQRLEVDGLVMTIICSNVARTTDQQLTTNNHLHSLKRYLNYLTKHT